MSLSRDPLINVVAPALRGLCAQGTQLPLVRFRDQGVGCAPHTIDLNKAETPEQVVASLKKALHGASPQEVAVADLGIFEIQPIPQDLTGRATGKVAMVTGAAQGFGLEIAQDLADQGAFVILTDINEAGVQAAAKALCDRHGTDRALGLAMNVTDGASVAGAIGQVVQRFGGLDLLVSNAGVLKAGSVKTQPVKDFDFVTAVNYKGFFICVQNVAPVMAVQLEFFWT